MGKSDKRFYKISRAKTFYKGDEFFDMFLWFNSQIERADNSGDIKKKYVIVIKEVR